MPVGKVPAASPSTYIDSGTVASETLGASVAPTIEPVAKITAEFAPVSACAAARRSTLARTRVSPASAAVAVTSIIGGFHPEEQDAVGSSLDFAHYEMSDPRDQPTETSARHAPTWNRSPGLDSAE